MLLVEKAELALPRNCLYTRLVCAGHRNVGLPLWALCVSVRAYLCQYRADFIPPALWSVLKSTLCFLNSVLGMLGSSYDFWDQLDECISKGRLCVAGIGCSTDQLEN